jgi:hypothetical protein
MMRRVFPVLLLLLLPPPAAAQTLTLPDKVQADGSLVVVKATTDCKDLRWLVIDPGITLVPPDLLKNSLTALVVVGKTGSYRLLAVGAKGDASVVAMTTIVVGTPPDPGPGPGPGPDPKPDPKPVPASKVKVLIIEDKKVRTSLPADQVWVLTGRAMRDYLNTVCAPEDQLGYGKAWAIWDKSTDVSNVPKFWQDALARPRTSLPWLHIANDKGEFLYGGPLPVTTAATVAVIAKYAPKTQRKAG